MLNNFKDTSEFAFILSLFSSWPLFVEPPHLKIHLFKVTNANLAAVYFDKLIFLLSFSFFPLSFLHTISLVGFVASTYLVIFSTTTFGCLDIFV